MKKYTKTLILICLCHFAAPFSAQTVKEIRVSQSNSYTDHITLKEDSKDHDLMVKFLFDEANNRLTVNLLSYRNLFVFQENTPYKQVVKRKKLDPDRLPYVVDFEENAKYVISKYVRKTIKKPRKQFLFKRWLDYDRLQAIPAEYKMVEDQIYKVFDIIQKDTFVTVTLNDILLIDQTEKSTPLKKRYQLTHIAHVNRNYCITIDRDPCFGKEDEVALSLQAVEAVEEAYRTLVMQFQPQVTGKSREMVELFNQMKAALLKQYVAKSENYECELLQHNWKRYNSWIDSISSTQRMVDESVAPTMLGVSPEILLENARKIDKAVSEFLLSQGKAERHDLKERCKTIIQSVNDLIQMHGLEGSNRNNAYTLYQKAVEYYKKNCLSK